MYRNLLRLGRYMGLTGNKASFMPVSGWLGSRAEEGRAKLR